MAGYRDDVATVNVAVVLTEAVVAEDCDTIGGAITGGATVELGDAVKVNVVDTFEGDAEDTTEGRTGRVGAVKVVDTTEGRTGREGTVGAATVASVAALGPEAAAAAARDGGKAAVKRLPGGGAMLETTEEEVAEKVGFLCKMKHVKW